MIPARAAAARTLSEAFRASAYCNQRSRLRSRASGRAGQGIERSGAGQAFITLKPARHTVTVVIAPLAMRAFQIGLKRTIDQLLRSISSTPLAYCINQLAGLGRRQFFDKFRQTAFEFAVLHDRPPDKN